MIVQKLTTLQKSNEKYFNRVLEINNLSYSGVQNPKAAILLNAFNQGDVYIVYESSNVVAGFVSEILGFAIVIDYTDIYEPLIWSIAVHPDHRGKGLATAMLMNIEEDVKWKLASTVRLTVNVNNPAQKLYFDTGYRVYNIARRHYLDEGDGLLMKKQLR